MTKPIYATSLDDSEGHLVEKLHDLMPALTARFQVMTAVVTHESDERILELLRRAGTVIDRADANLDAIGAHRRRAVEMAIDASQEGHIFRADLDHLLRWIEQDPDELDSILHCIQKTDCTVVGRGPASFGALPERMRKTESVVNHVYGLITGHQWDVMMSVRGLSRSAATLVATESRVDTVGNDVDWPLLCRSRDLPMNYVGAEGLTYRTEENYALDREDELDGVPQEWAFRILIAEQQMAAMRPYM